MEYSDEKPTSVSKKKKEKTGYNINNFVDTESIAKEFISFYFPHLESNNIQALIDAKTIREYTSIKYNDDIMKENDLITFLNNFSNYKLIINTFNFIVSGSRRIDISVIGNMANELENTNFNQTFIICHQDNSWYIKNSIFLTF